MFKKLLLCSWTRVGSAAVLVPPLLSLFLLTSRELRLSHLEREWFAYLKSLTSPWSHGARISYKLFKAQYKIKVWGPF